MINYRNMKIEDIPQVASIEKEVFSMPWSEKSFEESLQNKDTLYLVAEEDGSVSGYIGMYISFEIGTISNVVVAPAQRRKGIAKQLLERLLKASDACGVESVTLEVRESNRPAIELYEKAGFVNEGIRKNFYQKPTENAIIMWKYKE
ncbi:MAG: ribosomal protein S18-alanine N-acetyltransferase [Eubacterium sp.]|nr:ribosomal protein S18-alanine N-acetyltransferase [Eubacterium sp.]